MLSQFSVKRPYTVIVAVVLVIVLGVISYMGMRTDLLPEIELPYVVVVTAYPGASPEQVEQAATKPLESSLGTVSGLKKISSISQENSSIIIL
ncbi:MAG: efflux RND transporter permease subunit, partial [Dethiobacteria bacterium]